MTETSILLTYSSNSLHADWEILRLKMLIAVIQTSKRSDNVYNLVTKRARAEENATVEWIDGNLGAKTTMKYPSVYLEGQGARRYNVVNCFCWCEPNSRYWCEVIHNAPNTSSSIVSKSISKDGGEVNYRGQVKLPRNSQGSISHIECDTIIMDELSKSDTIPFNEIHNSQVSLEHEAKVQNF